MTTQLTSCHIILQTPRMSTMCSVTLSRTNIAESMSVHLMINHPSFSHKTGSFTPASICGDLYNRGMIETLTSLIHSIDRITRGLFNHADGYRVVMRTSDDAIMILDYCLVRRFHRPFIYIENCYYFQIIEFRYRK